MKDNNTEKNYFTAGELAALFNISRQTLLYYDKIGLLCPEFISPNGYRHYTISQYLNLEIIFKLRNLNFSIASIKEYLDNRNRDNIRRLLSERAQECHSIIEENQNINATLQNILANLQRDYKPLLNRISLSYHDKILLNMTVLPPNLSGKERISIFARHSQKTLQTRGSVGQTTGWVVTCQDFFAPEQTLISKAYFSYALGSSHKKALKYELPAGFYLKTYFQGTFNNNSSRLAEQLLNFMERNALTPVSDIFVIPVENHWFTLDVSQYINKLFIHVKHLN